MRILGIETSCDETAAAVVEDGCVVRSNVISTSLGMFEKTGGVIPEEAARMQLECIQPVIDAAMSEANCTPTDLDAIAVTHAPGLLGSLLVGTIVARTMSWVHGIPLVPVHHTLGHLSSPWLGLDDSPVPGLRFPPSFPILTLSVSGGHTDLWLRTSHTKGARIGATRDDAAGEAFDKGASLLGLPYPGGPAISALAQSGNDRAFDFPLPLAQDDSLDWSFSGLKTSLRYLLQDLAYDTEGVRPRRTPTQPENRVRASRGDVRTEDLAASYERAICRHLIDRVERALLLYPDVGEVHVVGGVSANKRLRSMIEALGTKARWPVLPEYCTDNGAMIATAGYFLLKEHPDAARPFETSPSLPLSLS